MTKISKAYRFDPEVCDIIAERCKELGSISETAYLEMLVREDKAGRLRGIDRKLAKILRIVKARK